LLYGILGNQGSLYQDCEYSLSLLFRELKVSFKGVKPYLDLLSYSFFK
jgi:hypothetical protein